MFRSRKFVAAATVVVLSLVFALFVGEILVRALDIPPRPLEALPIPDYQLSENPILRYEYRPNVSPDQEPLDDSHLNFTTNGQGFRDREFTREKPPGTIRIITLGDSTTAGNTIAELDDTWPKQLESLLDESFPGRSFQVMNMGVGGYHTLQEAETLRVKGMDYDPDYVLLLLCLNDFDINSDGFVYGRLVRANAHLRKRVASGPLAWFLNRSRLAFVLYYRIRGMLVTRDQRDEEYIEAYLKDKNPVRAGFELLDQVRAEQGVEVLVCILPVFRGRFSEYAHADIHAQVLDAAKGLEHIRVLDLTQGFGEINDDASVFSSDQVHPNEYGAEVLAGLLLRAMAENWPEAFGKE